MYRRLKLAVAVLCALAAASSAQAQIASIPPTEGTSSGWSFAVTPYVWMPTIAANMQGTGPRGNTVTTNISADIGQYLSKINFGAMLGGAARYDRFTVLTDIIYLNASLTSSMSHLSTVNPGPGPIDIPRSQQLFTGTRLQATIWSFAGGYTLLQGDWGNVDAVAGMRMLAVDSTTNFQLDADFYAPDRTLALSRVGGVGVNVTKVDGVGGITGRINIPNSKFYVPFYIDAGGGGMPFTWQAYTGIAYSVADWADVSVGYRYMDFQSNSGVRNLSLSGAILVANFHF